MLSHKRTIRIDIASSFVSIIASIACLTYFDLGIASIFLGCIVFLTGVIRAEPAPSGIWAKSFILIAPYGIFLLGAMNGVFHLFFLAIICVIGSFVGVICRQAFVTNRRSILFTVPVYLIGLYFYGSSLLPKFEDATMWNDVNKPLPAQYKLLQMGGDTIHAKELKGKILVFDFWATWCAPCNDEIPVVEKLYNKYMSDERVRFLVIACDRRDTLQKVRAFVKKSHCRLPFFIDLPEKLFMQCELGSIPTILMVDSKGIIRFQHQGYSGVENFEAQFDDRMATLLK